MPGHDYKFKDFEDLIKKIDDVTKPVVKHRKSDNKLGAAELKDKLGDKTSMATLIIHLTNACLDAKSLMSKMHGHNFELRGKVADLSSAAMKQTFSDVRENQTSIMTELNEVKNQVDGVGKKVGEPRSFSEVLGKDLDSASFVLPMKQAIKEIEKEDKRAKNVVIHGLDIDPTIPQEEQDEQIKRCAENCVRSIMPVSKDDDEDFEITDIKILGKLGASGKAPPVLMTFESSEDSDYLIRNSSRLSRASNFRRVFITPDLSKDAREERRKTIKELKRKISDFPDKKWVIKGGTVTSVGKFEPRRGYEDEAHNRSSDY